MKQLFFAIIIIASVNASGQHAHKATGDKPYAADEYVGYQGNDSTHYVSTVYTYNTNRQLSQKVGTYVDDGDVDSIVREYNQNRVVLENGFFNASHCSSKSWVYDEPNQQIDYYEGIGYAGILDSVYHIVYKGVKNFDEVDEAFSALLSFIEIDIEVLECDEMSIYLYDSSSWILLMDAQSKYQGGRLSSATIEIDPDYFKDKYQSLLNDLLNEYGMSMEDLRITNITLTLTPSYSGDRLTRISGNLSMLTNIVPIPIMVNNFIVLLNQYNGDILTERKIEMSISYMGYQQYLGGSIQSYIYNIDNNLSCVAVKNSNNGTTWELDSKTYYHYNNVGGIRDINGVYIAMYQNIPNPFSSNTEIACYIPVINTNAFIYIYNLQGVEVISFPITQTGISTVYISASTLPAGMYLYTLVVDDVIIDTKRMILTK